MSCGKPVVDLRARGLSGPDRFARVPPLHPGPRSWTNRLSRKLQFSKSQTPRKCQQSPKVECSNAIPTRFRIRNLGLWSLPRIWSLGFGISIFSLLAVPLLHETHVAV